MNKSWAWCVLLCARVLLAPGGAAAAEAFELEPGTRLLAPVEFHGLAVFPVVQATARPDNVQYLTLTEGLERKLVTVAENQRGATVNSVTVENHGDRPLLLLGGEIILGGQQDRILGKDTIVPAREKMAVQVFCVEHGRWSGGRQFTSTGGMVEGKARLRAKFQNDQSAVWAEVAKKTHALKAETQTGTYRSIATGPEGQKAIQPFRDAIGPQLAKLPEAKQMVGLVAAIHGRVTSVELFASPSLFERYRDRLLESFYVAAADAPTPAAPAATPKPEAVKEFMHDADAAPAETVVDGAAATTTAKRGKKTVNSELKPKAAAAPAPYRSYQSME